MKFSAVQHCFKLISEETVRAYLRKEAGRGEHSVYLDEVGLDVVAPEAARKDAREQVPAGQKIHP